MWWWTAALAQQPVRVVSPKTELQPCLDDAICDGLVRPLLSETILEFGALAQHRFVSGSALTGRGRGLHLGVQADTPVVGEPNLILAETEVPALVPTLEAGYQFGPLASDQIAPQFALATYLLPPLTIDGTHVGTVGMAVSAAVPIGIPFLWAGVDANVGYGWGRSEFIGDGSDIEDFDGVGDLIEVEIPACDSTAEGCQDRFKQINAGARLGLSLEPHPLAFVYGRVGFEWIRSHLQIAYDDSAFVVKGLQPHVQYGVGMRPSDRVQLSVGGTTAFRDEELSTDQSRALTRLGFSVSVRSGRQRTLPGAAPARPPPPAAEPPSAASTPPEAPSERPSEPEARPTPGPPLETPVRPPEAIEGVPG